MGFAETLFIQKNYNTAFNTWVATDLINHASDVPGDGKALALADVKGLLAASTIELQWVTVGQDHAMTFFKATTPMGVAAAMEVFRMSV